MQLDEFTRSKKRVQHFLAKINQKRLSRPATRYPPLCLMLSLREFCNQSYLRQRTCLTCRLNEKHFFFVFHSSFHPILLLLLIYYYSIKIVVITFINLKVTKSEETTGLKTASSSISPFKILKNRRKKMFPSPCPSSQHVAFSFLRLFMIERRSDRHAQRR